MREVRQMQAGELRDMQRPLKDRYRSEPEAAIVAARSEGRVDVDGLTCQVSGGAGILAGLHPAAGGAGDLACSADMLLDALVACAGVTLAAVATSMSVSIRGARIIADGHWDARGTLGVDRTAAVGMTDVTVSFEIDTDADADTVARLVELTERYCVVAQTLAHPPAMAFSHAVTRGGPGG
jgi:uncharacterized OsmC-like protein